jgi:hypothetical protein
MGGLPLHRRELRRLQVAPSSRAVGSRAAVLTVAPALPQPGAVLADSGYDVARLTGRCRKGSNSVSALSATLLAICPHLADCGYQSNPPNELGELFLTADVVENGKPLQHPVAASLLRRRQTRTLKNATSRTTPASRFSPAAYEKMRFNSARIEQISNGLTILQGLQPAGLGHWNSGSLYNPDDGLTYRVSAELHSVDRFLARVCLGVPLLGETKTPAAGSAPQVRRLELASQARASM